MIKNNQHILHRVNLEITTDSEAQAFALQNNINVFLKEQIFPAIEGLFDEIIALDEIKRFDSLELSMHLKSMKDMNSIKKQLINQLREKIEFADSSMSNEVDSQLHNQQSTDPKQNNENIFLSFLNNGQLPWYANSRLFKEYIESGNLFLSLRNEMFVQRLKELFETNDNSLKRFIQQTDNNTVEEYIFNLPESHKINRSKFNLRISRYDQSLKDQIYFLIISSLVQNNKTVSIVQFQDLFTEINQKARTASSANKKIQQIKEIFSFFELNTSVLTSEIQKPHKQTPNQQTLNPENEIPTQHPDQHLSTDLTKGKGSHQQVSEDQNEVMESKKKVKLDLPIGQYSNALNLRAVYIQNAGLILAHPFLWDLFSRTKCTDDFTSLLPDKKDMAVHLLHYLATGDEQDMEYNLTFEKFLCGIPLDSPINRKIILSDQSKIECNDLLLSIIRFWPELKSTSPDGLRQMFIQRSGKLDLHKSPFKLYIERKAQDVLLDKLQWNISIVKLPWINELLFTEW